MKLAIHQPIFFPWLGFFHKLELADQFVFFDHVQAVRGKNWYSRNKILLNGQVTWLTIPIKRKGKGFQKIHEIEINYSEQFTRKHLGTMNQAYRKCSNFNEIFSFVEGVYLNKFQFVSDFNMHFITKLCNQIGIQKKFLSSREIVERNEELFGKSGNELVLRLCSTLEADMYISGNGCMDFIEPDSFRSQGIEFVFQDFECREYPQNSVYEFVSHLSIIDALFSVGFSGVKRLIGDQIKPN